MAFTKETKTNIITDYKLHDNDTGSSEVQIALLTNRLNYLTITEPPACRAKSPASKDIVLPSSSISTLSIQ